MAALAKLYAIFRLGPAWEPDMLFGFGSGLYTNQEWEGKIGHVVHDIGLGRNDGEKIDTMRYE